MSILNRKEFFRAMAMAGLTSGQLVELRAQGGTPPADAAAMDVTRKLARWVVSMTPEAVPAAVRKEAVRTLLNWVGCALGGSRMETVELAVAAMQPFSGPAQATILGRAERLDILNASLANGISSHALDYDDTHLKTVIHPAGPVASAILALAEYRPVSGRDFLNALVLGVEVECRIGNAVYPEHYDRGWHITGTAGVFGAAAASGRLLGLNEQQMVWALGLAATQPVGLKEMFATMTTNFHTGRAAQNGLTAALLAQRGFTSSNQPIEAKAGWANVVSTRHDFNEITGRLGETYEISLNSYKPFATGIVSHPAIDGCLRLREQYNLTLAQVDRVDLTVHPLALELNGRKTPATGLESKFSVYFAAAVAIADGMAGDHQFSDPKARDAAINAVRDRVSATVDPKLAEDQARVAITLKDGRRVEAFVEHAVGSARNPMSDAALEAKFLDLAAGVLPVSQARKVRDLCRGVETLSSAAEIAVNCAVRA
jgi:2-methylcitrate dehydratase PrpD